MRRANAPLTYVDHRIFQNGVALVPATASEEEPEVDQDDILPARRSSPLGLHRYAARPRKHIQLIVLFFALACFGRSYAYVIRRNWPEPHDHWLRTEALTQVQVPRLAASGGLVPHLIHHDQRAWVHHLPNIDVPAAFGGGQVECLVFDSAVNGYPLSSEKFEAYRADRFDPGYVLEYRCETFKVYRREGAEPCLASQPPCGGAS